MVLAVVLLASAAVTYAYRVPLKDVAVRWLEPPLPTAEPYRPPANPPTDAPAPVLPPDEESVSVLPTEKRLAVPFLSQAPFAVWDAVHDEACEEASVVMVRAYYQGQAGRIDLEEGERALQEVVAFQNEQYGFFEDTSAAETKRFLEALYPELTATVVPFESAEQIKRYVADGIPVIVPADGKALENPNFRNGGPPYHMLVVRGYTPDHFITNDPGTRNGENFLYETEDFIRAIHDWNDGDVPRGDPVLLIVTPRDGT